MFRLLHEHMQLTTFCRAIGARRHRFNATKFTQIWTTAAGGGTTHKARTYILWWYVLQADNYITAIGGYLIEGLTLQQKSVNEEIFLEVNACHLPAPAIDTTVIVDCRILCLANSR